MRDAFLQSVYRLIRRRAWVVLLIAAVLSAVALLYIRNLPTRNSFLDLLPPGDFLTLKFQEREEIITKSDALSIVLALKDSEHSPRDTDRLKAAAEQLAEHLKQNPEIVSTSFTKEIQTRRGDQLLSLRDEIFLKLRDYRGRLRQIISPAEGQPSSVGIADLITLYAQINTELKKALGTELDLRQFGLNPVELVKRFEELKKLNESVKREFDHAPILLQSAEGLVTDLLATVGEIEATIHTLLSWPQELYLSKDGIKLLVNVRPRQSSQYSLDYNREITQFVQATLQRSDLDKQGLTAKVTGPYALAAETNHQLNVDMRNTTILSAIGVMLVVVLLLRQFFYPVLALIALFLALIANLAWAKFATNGLNLVTSFLPPLILGMGIDYGINFVAHFLAERRAGHRIETALKSAVLQKGGAIITASLATACVLFGLMIASSPGLYEMGIIAGIGILLALTATLLILPALMIVSHIMLRRRLHRTPVARKDRTTVLPDERARDDGFWKRAHWPIVLVTLAGSLFMLSQARHVGFRFADEDLAPQDLPARTVQQEVSRDFEAGTSGLGEYFLFFAPTSDELYRVTEGLEKLTQRGFIDAMYSLATFVPKGEEQQLFEGLSLNIENDLNRARNELDRQSKELSSLERLTLEIERLRDNLNDIKGRELQLAGGGPVSVAMNEMLAQLDGIGQSIHGLEAMRTRLRDLRTRLDQLNSRVQDLLEMMRRLQQVNELLNVLPQDTQERFVTEEREFIIYAHLKRSTINEPDIYHEFIRAARTFSDDFLGYSMIQEHLERKMKSDFQNSTLLASVIILVILTIGLGWRWALFGVVPVGLGFLWMLGIMRLSGLNFNFANIIISSLLIGNGVDYAVYLLHSFMDERSVGAAWKQTYLPILGSALTTMVSFGSLLFAATPGLRAFGLSALYGIGFTTLFTLVLLPALLAFFTRRTD